MIVSVPSYVIPGTYYENISIISQFEAIQAVELLFFNFDEETRDLFKREKEAICALSGRFAYTVHMPDPLRAEDAGLIELTSDLASHYVLHPPDAEADPDLFEALVSRWTAEYGKIFLLENITGRIFDSLVDNDRSLSVCCDTGDLLTRGEDVNRFVRRYEPRIKEIHLHGIRKGRDHDTIDPKEPWFNCLIPFLKSFQGFLNIEVFSMKRVKSILQILSGAVK